MKHPFRLLLCLALGGRVFGAEPTLPPRPWEPNAFLPVTEARIAALPVAEQPAWRAYWQASAAQSRPTVQPTDPVENASQPLAIGTPIPAIYSRGARLDAPADWYASEEARAIADQVVAWQRPAGGWTKGGDYRRAPRPEDDHHDAWSNGTFDNDSTFSELRFLALVAAAGGEPARADAWRRSFLRGLDYIFAAQYPNGGWPQIYPLAGSYHDAITFNDDAMIHLLNLLREIHARNPVYAFVPPDVAAEAGRRVTRGLQCLLDAQLRAPDGRRTIWGQQHDALTLQPCAARNFEPVAACSLESVSLVRFLMTIPSPSPEVIAAIEGAVAWFPGRALRGVVWDSNATTGTGLVPKDGATDLWARFYELGTERPIFSERDRMVHYTVTALSGERRLGYGWYNSRAAALPAAYAKWKAKLAAK
jgi:PelA/Pel-15E family pectate lyase